MIRDTGSHRIHIYVIASFGVALFTIAFLIAAFTLRNGRTARVTQHDSDFEFMHADAAIDDGIGVFPHELIRVRGLSSAKQELRRLADSSDRFAFDGGSRFAEIQPSGFVDTDGSRLAVVSISDIDRAPSNYVLWSTQSLPRDIIITKLEFSDDSLLISGSRELETSEIQNIRFAIPWKRGEEPPPGILTMDDLID